MSSIKDTLSKLPTNVINAIISNNENILNNSVNTNLIEDQRNIIDYNNRLIKSQHSNTLQLYTTLREQNQIFDKSDFKNTEILNAKNYIINSGIFDYDKKLESIYINIKSTPNSPFSTDFNKNHITILSQNELINNILKITKYLANQIYKFNIVIAEFYSLDHESTNHDNSVNYIKNCIDNIMNAQNTE